MDEIGRGKPTQQVLFALVQWLVSEMQIDPDEYYPEGYKPELLEEWPADSDIVAPVEALPENLRRSMGGHWELTQKNRQALEERNQ